MRLDHDDQGVVDKDADEHDAAYGSAMAKVMDEGGVVDDDADDHDLEQRHDHQGRARHCRHRFHPRLGGGLVSVTLPG